MTTPKILTVVGARPQFVKAATVSRRLQALAGVREVLVHTGQHYDPNMSQVFFEELEIPAPHYHLGVGSGSHGVQTGQMLPAIEAVLLQEKPDCVLVYGDTNSTLAGALAAAKLHIPVAHVEAGLRSFNRRMPEEVNRVLTDHVSSQLFCPTVRAVENLQREGLGSVADVLRPTGDRPQSVAGACAGTGAMHHPEVYLVGDVMYDAALYYARKAESRLDVLAALQLQPRGYILATIHRAENTGNAGRLESIFRGFARVAKDYPVVIPLHPRTRNSLEQAGLRGKFAPGLVCIEPVGYLDMISLEKHARLIVTDSGGVQKEAYFWRVPCVTLRDETEWGELVECGWNRVVPPTDAEVVVQGIRDGLSSQGNAVDLYGDGNASGRIVDILIR
jgi:UDP-GlcNAc3NAcA epimerase